VARLGFLAVVAALLAGCLSGNSLLNRANVDLLGCRPFETVVLGPFEVREISGQALAENAPVASGDHGLEGVSLVLRELGKPEVVYSAFSDEHGHFSFAAVPDGLYQLESCLEGFDSLVVVLDVSRRHRSRPVLLSIALSA
jgi:hypothetical protein